MEFLELILLIIVAAVPELVLLPLALLVAVAVVVLLGAIAVFGLAALGGIIAAAVSKVIQAVRRRKK